MPDKLKIGDVVRIRDPLPNGRAQGVTTKFFEANRSRNFRVVEILTEAYRLEDIVDRSQPKWMGKATLVSSIWLEKDEFMTKAVDAIGQSGLGTRKPPPGLLGQTLAGGGTAHPPPVRRKRKKG